MFGYYLEVRHAHKDKVPEEWIRKQTLTQAERYITEELKVLETRILDAKERALVIEHRLYDNLVAETTNKTAELLGNARAMGELDVLVSNAEIANENGPVIIICRSGRRSRIVSNMIIKKNSEYLIYHATNGIKSWIESNNKTFKPN